MDYILPEEQLIEYAKPYLKARGFKKIEILICLWYDNYKE